MQYLLNKVKTELLYTWALKLKKNEHREWAMRILMQIAWQKFITTVSKSECWTKHPYACEAEIPRKWRQCTTISLLLELVSTASCQTLWRPQEVFSQRSFLPKPTDEDLFRLRPPYYCLNFIFFSSFFFRFETAFLAFQQKSDRWVRKKHGTKLIWPLVLFLFLAAVISNIDLK